MSRFQFVADNSATFEVKRLCALVEIERSSYYAWKAGAPARADRAAADAELAERIRVIHEADNTVGAPRVDRGAQRRRPAEERVNHKRVARVMRAAGSPVTARSAGADHDPRAVRSVGPRPAEAGLHRGCAEPTLRRRHHLPAARRRARTCTWPPSSTATAAGSPAGRSPTTCAPASSRTPSRPPLRPAAARGLAGAVFHSDHGSVYTSKDYAKLCARPRRHPVDGCRGHAGRQRARRVVQRHPQTRGPPRRRLLARRAHLPPAGLQVADPLQHQAAPLLVPIPVTGTVFPAVFISRFLLPASGRRR